MDEHVRFVDDQIDAVTKTFLGLTVSCARCHHHKFDAISQDDYYAFLVFFQRKARQKLIDDPSILSLHDIELEAKDESKNVLSKNWQSTDFYSILNRKSSEPSNDPHDFNGMG